MNSEVPRCVHNEWAESCPYCVIERLTAKVAKLEAALSWVAEHAPGIEISIAEYAAKAREQANSEVENNET